MALPAIAGAIGGGGGILGQLSVMISATGTDKASKDIGKVGEVHGKTSKGIMGDLGGIQKQFGGVLKMFGAGVGVISGVFMTLFASSALGQMYMAEFGDVLQYIGDVMMEALAPIFDIMMELFWEFGDAFKAVMETIVPIIQTVVVPPLQMLLDLIKKHPEVLQALTIIILALVSVALIPLITIVGGVIAIFLALMVIWDTLGKVYNAVLKPVFEAIWWGITHIGDVAGNVWGGIKSAWDALCAGLKTVYDSVLEPLWNTISGAVSALWNNGIKPIWDALSTAWNSLSSGLGWVYNNIIQPIWNALSGAVNTMWYNGIKPIWDGFSAAWDALADGISWVYNNVIKPVIDAFSKAWDSIGGAWDTVAGGVGGAGDWLGGVFGDVIWRPGQAPIAISPDDTVMAFKGDGGVANSYGGSSASTNIFITVDSPSIRSDADIDELVEKIARKLATDTMRWSVG